MSKGRKKIGVIFAVLYSIMIAGASCFVGYKIAYGRIENSASIPQTFYAVISGIQDNALTVKGMEINDINFRGEFCFSIEEETKITWRYTDISIEDLDVGDNIAVSFTGMVLETDPARIQQVEIIQLLDDEK